MITINNLIIIINLLTRTNSITTAMLMITKETIGNFTVQYWQLNTITLEIKWKHDRKKCNQSGLIKHQYIYTNILISYSAVDSRQWDVDF